MKTFITKIALGGFLSAALIFSGVSAHPGHDEMAPEIKIKDLYYNADTIQVTIPNLHLNDNEKYIFRCEEELVKKAYSYAYEAPDVLIQERSKIKYDPTYVQLEVGSAKQSATYDCQIFVQIEEKDGRKYYNQFSQTFRVKTLENKVRNYSNWKKGRQQKYLERSLDKWKLNRYVTPQPTVITLRPKGAAWNAVAFGPDYYLQQFFR